jgi:hypothetical protein
LVNVTHHLLHEFLVALTLALAWAVLLPRRRHESGLRGALHLPCFFLNILLSTSFVAVHPFVQKSELLN